MPAVPGTRAVRELVDRALAEDGAFDDPSAALLREKRAKARVVVGEEGVVAGLAVAEIVFRRLDPKILFEMRVKDGDRVRGGQELAHLEGCARAIVAAERTALNLWGRLSGIATLTARYVEAVAGTGVVILDTRKTTPGLRALEKWAVRLGGGVNHRPSLKEMMLLKENHLALLGGVGAALSLAREEALLLPGHKMAGVSRVRLGVEVTDMGELREALEGGAPWVLLDNMSVKELREAVAFAERFAASREDRTVLEASGGVTLDNVREVAAAGVDAISVGALTHSASALRLSLRVTGEQGAGG